MVSKHPGANCKECPYLEIGKYVPPLNTNVPPKLIVLGEAPGANEARTGIPFTGASGKLLDSVLKHYEINTEEVIKQNTILCRPEGPTEKPPKKAIECCSNRLHKEIQESGVKTILAVGKTAANAALDSNKGITDLRIGPPKPYKYDPSISVIASVHPAFCLRSPDNFPTFVTDVGKVVNRNFKIWKEPKIRIFDDEETSKIALKRLIKTSDIGVIDIECGIEKDFNYAHPEDYEMLCVGIAYADQRAVVFGQNALKFQSVRETLSEYLANTKLIGHNLRFDIRGLSPLVGIHKQWFDTMLASRSMDERPGNHGLKRLAVERLGAPKYDDELELYVPRGGNYANVPRKILYKYNAFDVACTWDLFHYFQSEMDSRAKKEHDFMIDASNQLIYLELAGITFDHKYNLELEEEYAKELFQLEEKISDHIGREINPRSPQQVTRYFAEAGYTVETTEKDFLVELGKRVRPDVSRFIELLLEHRSASKLIGTYIRGLAKRTTNNKVYTMYTLHGTTSGRLASKNPNMQNIAKNKRIRNQFVVEHEDNVLIQIDYSQIEGRVIATLAEDDYLRGIFNDPKRDLFDELIKQIYDDKEVYDARRKIKSVWYGFCVPLDTKILTRRGWLTHDQVIVGVDETIGYDQELKKSCWTKINNVVRFNNEDVVRFGHSNIEFESTPNHRWLSEFPVRKWNPTTKKHLPRKYQETFVTTENIKAEHILQLAKKFESDQKLNITDVEAMILGLVFSDGTLKVSSFTGNTSQGSLGQRQSVLMRICQSTKNINNVTKIKKLLKNYQHTEYSHKSRPTEQWWNIPAEVARSLMKRAGLLTDSGNYKDVNPEQFALSLSDSQRKYFINGVHLGDGTKGKPIISQNAGWLSQVIRTIGYLEGYLVKSRIDDSSIISNNVYYKHYFAKPTLSGQRITNSYVGKKDVWCVQTDLGTWTMEQNGLIALTGNSYGRGTKSIAEELKIQLSEAQELVMGFRKIVTKTVEWQDKIKNQVLSGNDLVTPFGRKRSFYLITDENKVDVLNEALSFKPQSIASDICLSAAVILRPMLQGIADIRLTVHDALVFECHKDYKDYVIKVASKVMVDAAKKFTTYVDFAVDATIAKRLGDL